jgi:hypothetical protein
VAHHDVVFILLLALPVAVEVALDKLPNSWQLGQILLLILSLHGQQPMAA